MGLLAFGIWDIGCYANPNRIWLSVGILVLFNRYNVNSTGSRVKIPQAYIQVYKALEEGMCFFRQQRPTLAFFSEQSNQATFSSYS